MSLEDQMEQLKAQGIAEENIKLDTCTGTKMDRPMFNEILSMLKSGDELVVCKLDRFARTAPEGAMVVRDLVERGVKVNILNMGVADNTPMGKVMVTVMLAFAEYERDMIVERTSMGKAHKREHDPDWKEGRKRKKSTPWRREVRKMRKPPILLLNRAFMKTILLKQISSRWRRTVRNEILSLVCRCHVLDDCWTVGSGLHHSENSIRLS